MNSKLSLFIFAKLPNDFYLSALEGRANISSNITIAPSQFDHRDQMDFIFNGLTFSLFHFDGADMAQAVQHYPIESLVAKFSERCLSAIGIMPADHIASGKHSKTVNNSLLQLARYVGIEIEAEYILWQPTRQMMTFPQFRGATDDQEQSGPISLPLQITLSEQSDGSIRTTGLHYFCDQEIRFRPSFGFAPDALRKRTIHIAQKIAATGKISERGKAEGLFEGEQFMLIPDNQNQWVDVAIVADDPRQLH